MNTLGLHLRLTALLFLVPATIATSATEVEAPQGMKFIEGGDYRPIFLQESALRPVANYWLDETPVTNQEFLEFVRQNPGWRRSTVPSIFADEHYLAHWQGDLELGPNADPDAPVTGVSWFAARAYLSSLGKRLPTLDEWEYAARADEHTADATKDPAFSAKLLGWYSRPTPPILPKAAAAAADIHGIRGLHGVVWEWVSNFNNAMDTGEGRSGGEIERDLYCAGGSASMVDKTDYAAFMRYAMRTSLRASFTMASLGFRGAWSPETAISQEALPSSAHTALPPASIYQLGGIWRNQQDKVVPLRSLEGHWQVICMGYTLCKAACPRITAIMRSIEREISSDAKARTQFTFASFDPESDTPEQLAKHAQSSGLEHWNFLTSDSASVLELAAILGIKYEPYEGGIAHTNAVILLNPQGEIVSRIDGLGASIDPLVQALEEQAPPTDKPRR